METTRGVNEHHVIAFFLGVGNALAGDLHRVARTHFKNGNADLLADYLQLFYSSGSIYVAGYKQRVFALLFIHCGKLCTVSRFTRALETAHHYHRRRI